LNDAGRPNHRLSTQNGQSAMAFKRAGFDPEPTINVSAMANRSGKVKLTAKNSN